MKVTTLIKDPQLHVFISYKPLQCTQGTSNILLISKDRFVKMIHCRILACAQMRSSQNFSISLKDRVREPGVFLDNNFPLSKDSALAQSCKITPSVKSLINILRISSVKGSERKIYKNKGLKILYLPAIPFLAMPLCVHQL